MPRFFESFAYPFKGVGYLTRHKPLYKYVSIPMIIDLILSLALLYLLLTKTPEAVSFLMSWVESFTTGFTGFWTTALEWILKGAGYVLIVAMWIMIIILFPLILTLFSALVDPVFRGIIYSKTRGMEGYPEKSFTTTGTLIKALRTIFTELKKIMLYIALSLIFLLLNIVPVGGSLLYLIFQFLLSALFIGWEFLSPYLEEQKMSFGDQFRFVRKNKKSVIGFGTSAALLLLIPIAQAFFLSTHTIGGALLSIRLEKG